MRSAEAENEEAEESSSSCCVSATLCNTTCNMLLKKACPTPTVILGQLCVGAAAASASAAASVAATNWQRVANREEPLQRALIKHSRLSLAREQHQRSPPRWMTPPTLCVCERARTRAASHVRQGRQHAAALSVTNVPLFCFIVS
ncbi:uncharacterized protein LOC116804860 [Drosophila mojavensis]|uniref:uncharacterized protein LOC116804860 n=1 Tax=Drosophila mojavensis TaxID=7230 RepID=UPI0013EECE98|nr:uncharacterized protein LOC116804860 [Drosophila mojavensis]